MVVEKLSLDAVETYIKYKTFDVIGNGTYRRYVNTCKEKNEAWAVAMLQAVSEVQAVVRAIQTLVNDLQAANKTGLHMLCQTVMENNTPPIEQNTVIAECCVSGKQKCQCIILKCKGRGAPCIMVQGRFGHFVLMLWTVFKMDLVIKTVTRDFIDSVDGSEEVSMRVLCDRFLEDGTRINRLSLAVLHALEHVRNSLHHALVT